MASVRFTRHLGRFFPDLHEGEPASGATVAEILLVLDRRHPGPRDYLVDESGALRRHVNIFVDGALVRDRRGLGDPVDEASQLFIVQALSGG